MNSAKHVLFESWCTLLSLVAALILGGLVLLYIGASPAHVYQQLILGAVGRLDLLNETLAATTPYLLCGLALSLAFKAGLFNIGAEGQLFMGAMAAAIVGRYMTTPYLGACIVLLVAFGVGMFWGAIPAWLKIRFGVHEVINTIMLNAIAFAACTYVLKLPSIRLNAATPQTADVARQAQIGALKLGGLQLDRGLLIGMLIALGLWYIIRRSWVGFEIRVVGAQPEAGQTAGISERKVLFWVFACSGGLAGLAGGFFVSAPAHPYFQMGFSPGWGFWGIALALLARNHPLALLPAAFLFGMLETGSGQLQLTTGIPREIAYLLEALIILFISSRIFHKQLDPHGKYTHA